MNDLVYLIERLRMDLMEQWAANHSEHCNNLTAFPCPKGKGCHWPLPDTLAEMPHGRLMQLAADAEVWPR